MFSLAFRFMVASLAIVASGAVLADASNGVMLYQGQPSARFPSGSHPCTACHDVNTGADPIRNAAAYPQAIDSAINAPPADPSSKAMKPLYGVGGESPLSSADEQDLAEYINDVVDGIAVGGGGNTGGAGNTVTVVEYYDAGLNHYFITSNTTEIGLLGKPPFQDWQPTGLSFSAYSPTNPPSGTVGVCRFYNDHFLNTSTHFYAPHGLGCEQVISSFPDWTLEDPQLFFASVPDTNGNCPTGEIPVYRLYNNGMGGAPNHRFTISTTVRQQMIDAGYIPEGNGIGVGWCAPQ